MVVLPDNADPDEFIKQFGVEAYQERRGKALPHIHLCSIAGTDRNLRRPADKAAAVEEVFPYVRAVRILFRSASILTSGRRPARRGTVVRQELWQALRQAGASSDNTSVRQKVLKPRARSRPWLNKSCLNCSSMMGFAAGDFAAPGRRITRICRRPPSFAPS